MRILRIASVIVLSGSILVACSDKDDDVGTNHVVINVDGSLLSVQEAEEILDFNIRLPQEVPQGALNQPELTIERGTDGDPELVVSFPTDRSSSERVAIRVIYANHEFSLPDNKNARLENVNDIEVSILDVTRQPPTLFAVVPVVPDDQPGMLINMAWLDSSTDSISEDERVRACVELLEQLLLP